jgi:uncharacterized protein YkwD
MADRHLALLLAVLVMVPVMVGLERLRAPAPDESPSQKRSACGSDAGEWARELDLRRTQELTICLLNERRARHALVPLTSEPRLEIAAQRYTKDMVTRRFFAHDDLNGLDPQDRILMAGYPALHLSTGENLAWGTGVESSPVEIVDGWMHSPGHRANILEAAFTEVGVGVSAGIPADVEAERPGATYATSFGGPPVPPGYVPSERP